MHDTVQSHRLQISRLRFCLVVIPLGHPIESLIDFCDLEMDHDLPVPVNSPHVPNTPTMQEMTVLSIRLRQLWTASNRLIECYSLYGLVLWCGFRPAHSVSRRFAAASIDLGSYYLAGASWRVPSIGWLVITLTAKATFVGDPIAACALGDGLSSKKHETALSTLWDAALHESFFSFVVLFCSFLSRQAALCFC